MASSHCIINHTTLPVDYGLTHPVMICNGTRPFVFTLWFGLSLYHFFVYLTSPQLNARSDHPIGIKLRSSILFDHQCHNNI
ncbi:hypothetical protein YC2023_117199 [Brassica napus]